MIRMSFLALALWMVGALAVAAAATVLSVEIEASIS
jgi:hypothetical protein